MNILITGGAGTLGRAFVRHLREKHDVTVVDNSEWAIAELQAEHPDIEVALKDFAKWRFNQYPADVIIHLAAYKHVNLGETNPHSFIENNVTKTAKLFAEAYKHDTDILFVSTDKAVEPISVYGYTKALGEKLAWHYNGYVARLGNIIGSNGSVIPLWEQAIAEKQPIKITDERMTRYVIDADEAVDEIWKGYMSGSRLIVPTMGSPVRLLDMLTEVLRRHGYERASDYAPGVEVIGIRPGEKLEEKLKWSWE